eukprot:gene10646-15308_t
MECPVQVLAHQGMVAGRWEDLTHDPRTGLPFIKVPKKYEKVFRERDGSKQDMNGRAMHWLSDINRHWNTNRRILMISDKLICLCMLSDGQITRCVQIKDLIEMIKPAPDPDEPKAEKCIALKITQNKGADGKEGPATALLFCPDNQGDKPEIIEIIRRVYQHVSGGKELPIRSLESRAHGDGGAPAEGAQKGRA